jgi:outer membrane cobalamin receptor
VNRTQVRAQGVEATASLTVARWIKVNGWGSFLNWKVESSSEPLRNQPRWNSGITIEVKLPKAIRASSTTTWVGRRYDFEVPAPAVTSVGGFSTTNLVLGYEGLKRTTIYARIDNLFNAKFHEYLGFPNPGISAQIGVTYRLR